MRPAHDGAPARTVPSIRVRLGELLVRSGLLTPRHVELALRAQVMWGGRLGTNVVELHGLDLDALSRLIARQHGLPAAFAAHFEAADPVLQAQLSPELAAQYACVPLRRLDADRVVLASIAPLDGRARALVADELGISYKGLVPALAAELRIHYHLERVYDIPRETRFLRSRKPTAVFDVDLEDLAVDDTEPLPARTTTADRDEAIPDELLPDFTPRVEVPVAPVRPDRRHYIRMLDDEAALLGRIELVRRRVGSGALPALAKPPASLDEALLALRRSTDRDAIAHRVVDATERFVRGRAMLLVVRGDAATSYRGDIAIPLDEPNVVASALAGTRLAGAGCGNPIDAALLRELGAPGGDLVVAPIAIAGQVWSLIVVAIAPGGSTDGLTEIAAAAAIGFARLLRYANR